MSYGGGYGGGRDGGYSNGYDDYSRGYSSGYTKAPDYSNSYSNGYENLRFSDYSRFLVCCPSILIRQAADDLAWTRRPEAETTLFHKLSTIHRLVFADLGRLF